LLGALGLAAQLACLGSGYVSAGLSPAKLPPACAHLVIQNRLEINACCPGRPACSRVEAYRARRIGFSLSGCLGFIRIPRIVFDLELVAGNSDQYAIYCCKKIPLDAAKSFHLDQHQFLALPITVAVTYAMAASFWNLLGEAIPQIEEILRG
jgi:hypothetical protein